MQYPIYANGVIASRMNMFRVGVVRGMEYTDLVVRIRNTVDIFNGNTFKEVLNEGL